MMFSWMCKHRPTAYNRQGNAPAYNDKAQKDMITEHYRIKDNHSQPSYANITEYQYKNKDMKIKSPKTTLLITTYNWPEALERTVRSAFDQTVAPDEIVIADDGSTDETRQLIERLGNESRIPIIHVWQEDKGFLRTTILNKGIAKASGEYILQVDGDVILSRHFVSDHLELAEPNYFVCGSRVKLSPEITQKVFANPDFHISLWNMPPSFALNSLRSRLLRRFMALRYGKKIDHLRGCNMAYWKADIIKINGYNEKLTQWGHEDGEMAYRLHFAGVGKKSLKMGGCVYHLYHKEASRDNEHVHTAEQNRVIKERLSRCDDGIDKYL